MPKAPAYDADAQAFITATGITDLTQKNAINQLVLDLKGYSIWTKMKALYPFVGGTATTHKYNLKNPLDTDAAFRLIFSGGITHNSNGITGTVNGNANTFVNDANDLSINDKHISMYQRNILSDPSNTSMGINAFSRFYLNSGGNNYSTLSMLQSPFTRQTPQQGMFIMSKIIVGEFKYYQNALTAVTKTGTNIPLSTTYRILAGDAGSEPSLANIAFASLGTGLSTTDAANLRTTVQAFQTALSRNV